MEHNDPTEQRPPTDNDVDNLVNIFTAIYDGLPQDMQLVLEAFEDDRLEPAEAVAYLVMYDAAHLAIRAGQRLAHGESA